MGKSTLIEHVLKGRSEQVLSFNLEKDRRFRSRIDTCEEFADFEELLADEHGFKPDGGTILYIDEGQESLRLGSFVRFMKESWARASVILSGSTLTRLFRDDIRFPVGRVDRMRISPYSFSEFLRATDRVEMAEALERPADISSGRHQRLLESYDVYIQVGGMPAVVADHVAGANASARKEELLADYEDDFKRILGEENLAIAMACLRSVASFAGGPSKNTSVVAAPTNAVNHRINEIFARLESWGLVHKCVLHGPFPHWTPNYLPKRYLFDTGILRALREAAVLSLKVIECQAPDVRQPLGGIIENQVAIDIARSGQDLAGWRKTSAGGEIDFILKRGERAYPLECKAATTIKHTHLKGIVDYQRLYGLKIGFTASASPFEVIDLHEGMHAVNVPVYSMEHIHDIVDAHTQG